MRTTSFFIAILAAGLVACGTVSEPQQPVAPAPTAQEEAPAPVPVAEPVPVVAEAAAPVATAPAPAPVRKAVKAVRVTRKAPAPVAVAPAPASAPTGQERAAALAFVDEALNRFVLEQMRFTAPARMKRDASGAATLDFVSAGAFEKVREAIAGNEQVRKAGIQVSSRVQSRLVGESIEVKAGSPEGQELSEALPGQWKWELLPSAEGKAKLHLVISVETTVDGSAAPRAVHTLDKEILVEAAAPAPQQGSFFSANWWWMLIVAVVATVGAWFMRRKAA